MYEKLPGAYLNSWKETLEFELISQYIKYLSFHPSKKTKQEEKKKEKDKQMYHVSSESTGV